MSRLTHHLAEGDPDIEVRALTLEDVRTGQREQVPRRGRLRNDRRRAAHTRLRTRVAGGHGQARLERWLRGLVKLNDRGFIRTGRDVPLGAWPLPRPPLPFETSLPGVFRGRRRAVRLRQARVAGAVGERVSRSDPGFGIYAGLPLACRLASPKSPPRGLT
jgi:thioredoxin reductase (NADPH)